MTRAISTPALVFAAVIVAGCRAASQPVKQEAATLNVTHWTQATELYMEYPPLVAGQSARFAVHLTKLDDFKALNEGTPSIEFVSDRGGGVAAVLRGSPPSRPGAFRVDGV